MSASAAVLRSTITFVAIFFLVCVGVRGQAVPRRSTEEMQVKKLKVNDVELAYVEEGTGEPVVFVHGFTGDWRSWDVLRPFISEKYHYVSLSRRYHYPNVWTDNGWNYSITQHAEDVAAFIRALNVGKVHLVGNSGGGRIVGYVALKYPELLRSVVMGEPSIIASDSSAAKTARAAADDNQAKVLAAMKAGDTETAMRLHYDAIAGEQGAWAKLPVDRQRQRLDNATTVIPTLTGSRTVPVTCEELGALRVPALVVNGERTPANFRYASEALLRCLPKTTATAVIPGAHHEWYSVNPEASANAILGFIAAASVKKMSIGGTAIAYVEQGTGTPVVFLHGAFSDHRIWDPQREPVAKRYRFIAIDQRYFGAAPWSNTGAHFSPATHVSDLAAFIRALNAGPVYLVGRSYGASIALATAVRHPDLVHGLLLNEPQADLILVDPSDKRRAAEDRKGFAAVRATAETGNVNEATKQFYEWVNNQPGGFDALPAASRAKFLDNARTVPLHVSAPTTPTTCAQAGQLKVPVIITKGELTRPFFRVIAEATNHCIPGSELITIEGARHGAPTQQTAAFNKVLLAFLAGQTARAPQRSAGEMQVKKLKVNEIELAYVEEGKGDTVVFVHGCCVTDWISWERLRPFISGKFHYVSLSRRYHYPNPWMDDGRNYTMAQHVEDVAAFIRALNIGKVHLVGNSYGGGVVGRVALKYPELLRSVVVGEGLLAPVSAEGKAAVAAAQEDREKFRQAVEAGDLRRGAILQYDNALGEQGAFEKLPPERQQQLLYNAKTLGPEQQGRGTELTCEQLGTLSVPALLIRGEKTGAPQRYRFEATISCLPKTAEAAIIPGAPHGWYMRNPEDSAKAILAFIAKH